MRDANLCLQFLLLLLPMPSMGRIASSTRELPVSPSTTRSVRRVRNAAVAHLKTGRCPSPVGHGAVAPSDLYRTAGASHRSKCLLRVLSREQRGPSSPMGTGPQCQAADGPPWSRRTAEGTTTDMVLVDERLPSPVPRCYLPSPGLISSDRLIVIFLQAGFLSLRCRANPCPWSHPLLCLRVLSMAVRCDRRRACSGRALSIVLVQCTSQWVKNKTGTKERVTRLCSATVDLCYLLFAHATPSYCPGRFLWRKKNEVKKFW